jgi:hypothetical protein
MLDKSSGLNDFAVVDSVLELFKRLDQSKAESRQSGSIKHSFPWDVMLNGIESVVSSSAPLHIERWLPRPIVSKKTAMPKRFILLRGYLETGK